MSLIALGLILVSAFLHAGWNLLAKRAAGGLPFIWLLDVVSVVAYAPLAVAVFIWRPPGLDLRDLLVVAGSALLHFLYFISLQRGYKVGDLSLVYPLARGTGPMLSMVAAILLLGERPTPLALAGGGLIVLSVFLLTGGVRLFGRTGKGAGQAVAFGLLTGVFIASYTLFDKYAVGMLLIPPLLYNWLGNLGRAVLVTPLALTRWEEVGLEWREHRLEVLGVALLSPLAYILVLSALVFTPVSYVAPAREISILIATIMGARLLSEGDVQRRLAAASLMVLGVVALALG